MGSLLAEGFRPLLRVAPVRDAKRTTDHLEDDKRKHEQEKVMVPGPAQT